MSNFVSIKLLSRYQDSYWCVISYICVRKTKIRELEVKVCDKGLRLDNIFARKFCVNMGIVSTRSKYPYVYFAEQCLVNLDLWAFRSKKSEYVLWWSGNEKHLWMSMPIFLTRKIFVLFGGMKQIQDIFTTLSNYLRSSLSKNNVFCWILICLTSQAILYRFESPPGSMKKRKITLGKRLVSPNNTNKYQLTFNFHGNFLPSEMQIDCFSESH